MMDDLEDIYGERSEEPILKDQNETATEETSIYGKLEDEDKLATEDTGDESQNYTFIAAEKKLCFIGNDATYLSTNIIYEFGLKTLTLDISFNCFSDLRDLQQFPHLEELICDNNTISENSNFPKLESLRLLSLNKNKIENIHILIDKIKTSFPNITYLSLLGNVACPNQLIDTNKDEYDYARYRKYVIFRMKNLRFLDCYEVTKTERELSTKDSLFYDVVKLEQADDQKRSSQNEDNTKGYTPLSKKNEPSVPEVAPQSSFGYCKYVYHGKQSEGNRFIRNDDL